MDKIIFSLIAYKFKNKKITKNYKIRSNCKKIDYEFLINNQKVTNFDLH